MSHLALVDVGDAAQQFRDDAHELVVSELFGVVVLVQVAATAELEDHE